MQPLNEKTTEKNTQNWLKTVNEQWFVNFSTNGKFHFIETYELNGCILGQCYMSGYLSVNGILFCNDKTKIAI